MVPLAVFHVASVSLIRLLLSVHHSCLYIYRVFLHTVASPSSYCLSDGERSRDQPGTVDHGRWGQWEVGQHLHLSGNHVSQAMRQHSSYQSVYQSVIYRSILKYAVNSAIETQLNRDLYCWPNGFHVARYKPWCCSWWLFVMVVRDGCSWWLFVMLFVMVADGLSLPPVSTRRTQNTPGWRMLTP